MVIRIVVSRPQEEAEARFDDLARGLAALLVPASLIAFTIACWGIAVNFHWATNFFVPSGLFSHWQVWMIVAAVLILSARLLNRYVDRRERDARYLRSRFS